MKRLTVLRHAKSSWDDPDLGDFHRPLNDRGWEAARRMGGELGRRDFRFDIVFASPAVRVRETIEGVQAKFEFSAPIRFDASIYLAEADALLRLIRDLPDTVVAPLIVGHNPGLQQLVLDLAGNEGPERASVRKNLPTAAVAAISLPIVRWSELAPGTGTLVELITPRELD